jgi:hypothetical protein
MSPEMRVVVEIAAAGMLLLFAALGALVSLMYLLTNPTIFGEPGRERRRARRRARQATKEARRLTKQARRLQKGGLPAAPAPEEGKVDARQERIEEHDRRRRAAALAAAAACARDDAVMVLSQDASAEWRLFHRTQRLTQRVGRRT